MDMGNQAGKQKGGGDDGEAVAPGSDAGVPAKHKKGLFGRTGSPPVAAERTSQPIDFAREAVGGSGDSLPTKSPSSGAMPVPSPKNLPSHTGAAMPYKRPKGTIEWDSEDDEDMEETAAGARKSDGSQGKVSFSDFEVPVWQPTLHSHALPVLRTPVPSPSLSPLPLSLTPSLPYSLLLPSSLPLSLPLSLPPSLPPWLPSCMSCVAVRCTAFRSRV